jgi:hypothetical protein
MTNDEKVAWLDQCNRHLAQGGKLEHRYTEADNWMTSEGLSFSPNWLSHPERWRIVPLPRKAVIRVAYRWTDGGIESYVIQHKYVPGDGWEIKEIEVEDV